MKPKSRIPFLSTRGSSAPAVPDSMAADTRKHLRRRTWEIVEAAKPGDTVSRAFDIFLITLIFLNVLAVVIGSVEAIQSRWDRFLHLFEVISIAIFTVEYLARLWSCTINPGLERPIVGRLKFAVRLLPLIDLVSILPFYLPLVNVDLRAARAFRLLRIIRVAKMGRYYSSLKVILNVVKSRKEELVLSFTLMFLLLIISSSVLYCCENSAQPETFSSIPATMWWAVSTLTTVGYGDMYPLTAVGRICAGVIAILGIGMFALPTGILGAGFVEEFQSRRTDNRKCPHCGKELL